MSKVGLLFGSFNPVHNGHLALARAALADAGCNQVWFVLQQHNPFKAAEQTAPVEDRMAMLRRALQNQPQFKLVVSDAASMIDGLDKLKNHFKDDELVLLLGQDLVDSLPKWPDHAKIINKYQMYGYRRETNGGVDISSEVIRGRLAAGEQIAELVPPTVADYIRSHHLYL